MAEYQVLARKYRSTTFDEVVGQEPIAHTLTSAIATGRVAHAYLFTGTRGVGKTTMARIFAKALNCLSSEKPTSAPCNKCDACIAISRGDDVDVVEIDGASNRGIEEIRQLRANAIFRPARSRYKIYYIDEVHMLTKEAFNALLKTLEEPPEHVKFIFATTEAEKVPATILSRCQRFDFRDIPTRDIAAHLRSLCKSEEVQADEDALFRVAQAAAGSMRDGLSLLDQLLAAGGGKVSDADVVRVLGTPSDERMLAIAKAIAQGNAAQALGELHAVLHGGVSLPSAVNALAETLRNAMLSSVCGPATDLIELPDTQRQAVGELAKSFSLPSLVQAIAILHSVSRSLRTSSVARAMVEAAIVRLSAADKFVDPQSLLERLEAMGSGTQSPAAQKKNLPLSQVASREAPSPVRADSAAPAVRGEAPAVIQRDAAWLGANWKTVLDALLANRQMQVVGLLGPAKVLALEGNELRLGFDIQFESLRLKCAGDMKAAVDKAMSEVLGSEVQCQCVACANGLAGPAPVAAGGQPAAPPRVFGDLSTAEKAEIHKHPAVKAVMDLFDGEIVDIRRDAPGPVISASAPDGQDEAKPE